MHYNKLKISHLLLIIFCLSFSELNAQINLLHLPSGLPKPNWYNKVNWSNPNVFVIDSLIAASRTNTSKIYKDEEDPYITAYIRWRNAQAPFIQKDGSIKIDTNYYKNLHTTNNVNTPTNRTTASANWTALGPIETFYNNQKRSAQANIYALATTASNSNLIYAGSETGVLFKSIDKGISWVSVNDNYPAAEGITAIGISNMNSNKVYYYNRAGLFLTVDGGSTFNRLNNYTYGEINRIIINDNTDRVLVASTNGIYYSDNNGTNWTLAIGTGLASNPNNDLYFSDIAKKPTNSNIIYAVSRNPGNNNLLMHLSTNGGTSFTSTTVLYNGAFIKSSNGGGARLAVTNANANIVYCAALEGSATGTPVVMKSVNSGTNWNVTAVSPIDVTNPNQSFFGINTTIGLGIGFGQGYYDFDIAVSPTNENEFIIGNSPIFKSTDGGINFAPIGGYYGSYGGSQLHPDLQMMAVAGNDTYMATDGGIISSTDFFTNNGIVKNNGLTASDYWGFGQGWQQDIVVGGRYHNGDDVMYENYGAGNSLYVGGGEDATGHVFHGQKNTVGFRDLNTKVIPEALSGEVIDAEIQNTIWPMDDFYGLFSSKLMVDPRYANTFYVGNGNQFLKSTNYGLSYVVVKDFATKVWRFDIARSNPNYIYLCTQNLGIQKTVDGGATWSTLNLPAGVVYEFYNTDIAVNPLNENEVYFSMRNGTAANKIFKTINGGATWTNITGTALNNKEISYILYHGNNGAVYAITGTVPCEVYFKDNSVPDWILFNDNLPKNIVIRGGCGIFFRDNKLRFSGTRGVWQTSLATDVKPVAQPMANKQLISCGKDTVSFYDYSILNYTNATWQWSFPGASYVSSATAKNPKVLYSTIGNYDVTLTVTDAMGNSHTKTVPNMINFATNNCKADTVAGKSLIMKGANTPINIGKAEINSNHFSISCWIKPNGNQISFAQLISHDPYTGSGGYGFGLGFTFSGYTPNLQLCYTDGIVGYNNYSGLIATNQKWNYVVLTYTPTGVYLYLNGIKAVVNNNNMPVIDLSKTPFYINKDIHNQNGFYDGEIDEVKIYDYALTDKEVREKMHLIPNDIAVETGLLNYCQFNQYNAPSNSFYELINSKEVPVPDISNINNFGEVPVGTGSVFTIPNVNSSGLKDFTGTGIKAYFNPNAGTIYPNGDLVGFRLRVPPHTKPDTRPLSPDSSWFFINNYGTNTIFTNLDSIRFENLKMAPFAYTTGSFKLFKRPSYEHSNTWGAEQDSADRFVQNAGDNSMLTFSTNNQINSFSQFSVVSNGNLGVLPITLLSFVANANVSLNGIELFWRSIEDLQFSYYAIERSTDGINFSEIIKVQKNSISQSAQEKKYSYLDQSILQNIRYYYRLKIINLTGLFTYSPIQTSILKNYSTIDVKVFPNPCTDYLYVELVAKNKNEKYFMCMYDANGLLVYKATETLSNQGVNTILLNFAALAKGVYVLKINASDKKEVVQKINIVK